MRRTVLAMPALAQALRAALPVALLAALCAGCATAPAVQRGDDARMLASALDAGDLGPLVATWAREPSPSALRSCVLARLRPAAPSGREDEANEREDEATPGPEWPHLAGDAAPLTVAVSAAFAEAWRGQLLGELAPDEAEQLLARLLAGAMLEQHAGLREAIEPPLLAAALGRTLAGEGVRAFVARRDALLDLLLWRGEEVRRYDVVLPDGRTEVQVRLLERLLVAGVRAWASCDAGAVHAASAAGDPEWDDGTTLLLARDAVDTEGEWFRARLLARAAQRRWDDARLPRLDEAEGHYRIALAELARVESDGYAQAALARLAREAGRGRGEPRAHAAWALLQALAVSQARVDLQAVRAASLRQEAEGLLRASTIQALAVRHGERVHFLPD